jgi:hypothetical protein
MEMRATIFGALLSVAVANAAAEAQDPTSLSANAILPGCKAWMTAGTGTRLPTDPVALVTTGQCIGTIETLVHVGRSLPSSSRFCAPAEGIVGQAARVAILYIESRPQRTHENFTALAIEALHDAWPCKQ